VRPRSDADHILSPLSPAWRQQDNFTFLALEIEGNRYKATFHVGLCQLQAVCRVVYGSCRRYVGSNEMNWKGFGSKCTTQLLKGQSE
jgi:hypothetical protein